MQESAERRKYFRADLPLKVNYTVIDAPVGYKQISIKDIGAGGMRLPFKEELAPGTLLDIQLELTKEQKSISLKARVIWVRPIIDNRDYPYEAGLEFIDLDFAKRNMINNYIMYLDKEEFRKEYETFLKDNLYYEWGL